jgi:hypothetical protein
LNDGQLYTGGINPGDIILQAVVSQLIAVGAKGIGLNDLRASFDIFAVDLRDQGGLGQIESIEALIKFDTTRVQHGAHRAVR